MKRTSILPLIIAVAACGGGEPAEDAGVGDTSAATSPAPAAASSEMTMRDWFHVDEANQSVHMTITAGLTDAKMFWNFNGATDGDMTITVPVGYTVMIDFKNDDPNMAHSLGISAMTSGFGASVDPTPAFEGALTQNATSMMDATMPGEEERITFTADAAGEYTMVCYIPGHAATGMWVRFNVSTDGQFGVQGGM
jgi:sulfocyanin